MSIFEVDTIDFCWRDKKDEGKLFLAFTDHLDWENEDEHLKLLQNKLNTYLSYIENETSYIVEDDQKLFIRQNFQKFEVRIIFKKEPANSCLIFLKKYSNWLKTYLSPDKYNIEIVMDFSRVEKTNLLRRLFFNIKRYFA